MSGRRLRFVADDREALERVLEADLPEGMEPGPVAADFFREVFWDTEEDALAERGARVRVRTDGGGTRTLTVAAEAPGGERRCASAPLGEAAEAEALAGDGEPARLVRALADPERLEPRLELATTRTLRRARLRGGGDAAVAVDAVVVRGDGARAEMFGVEVRLPGDAPDEAAARVHRWAEALGLRPARADRWARARACLVHTGLDALERAARGARRVALAAVDAGRLALAADGAVLRVPSGPGRGEEAARAVARAAFGRGGERLRLLGVGRGSAARPTTEVWLAEGIGEEGEADRAAGRVWMPLDAALAAVGSPALRDAATLTALEAIARSDLPLAEGPRREAREEARELLLAPPSALIGPAPTPEESLPPGALLNMELGVLAFNRRVLDLAAEGDVPLLERVRFVSIFAANLDEFFRVRVAGFQRQVAAGSEKRTLDGVTPGEQLDAVAVHARRLADRAYELLEGTLLPALEERAGVRVVSWKELDREERERMAAFHRARVAPELIPLAAGPGHPFPHIRNLRPALGAIVRAPGTEVEHFVVAELPGGLPRFVPVDDGGRRLVPLEEVIRARLGDLYPDREVVSAHVFRVTRSAELALRTRRVEDLLHAVEEEVLRRPYRPVVRLEVEASMPPEMRRLLVRELLFEERERAATLTERDLYTVSGPIDLRSLREIAEREEPSLHYPPLERRDPVGDARPLSEVLREREVLVHFPFDDFEASVERLVTEAAEDPRVAAIKLALYRTDRRSRIVEALRRAAARGKQVVALVELTARFDEQSNIRWARYLREAGIHVIHGVPGLKVHAKVALIVRREDDGVRRYAYVGTGNLNAATAGAYTDLGLLSADPALGEDLHDLFNVLSGYAAPPERWRRLLVAPHGMRERFVELIDRETEHARAGRGGSIRAKCNGLADRGVVAALYRASRAGVRVELVVRGICVLRPGVQGLSENIRVVSILGRFLEHSRIYRFGNAGEPEHWIGSADWRTRNLSRRVEVATSVREPEHRAHLDAVLERELNAEDAWELGADGTYYRRPARPPHAGLEREEGRQPIVPRPEGEE